MISSEDFERFALPSVAVIGDIMLDAYLQGDVNRISPEAPVPVVHWASERLVLGGAANVAANVAALGARAHLIGLVGNDEDGYTTIEKLQSTKNVECSGVVIDPKRMTTKKTRIVSQNQQIVRLDRERATELDLEIEDNLIQNATRAIDDSDIVVLSDYAKGCLTKEVLSVLISYSRKNGKTVIVDPKKKAFDLYRGASIVKPNRSELALASGYRCVTDAEIEAAVKVVQEQVLGDILVTRSEHGMSYFPYEGTAYKVKATAKEISDVSGAGDTVVAVLAVAIAAGFSRGDAVAMSNHAGGIVVGRFGTCTITRDELMAAWLASSDFEARAGETVDLVTARRIREFWRLQGLKVGFTNGCFDLLHPGHIALLKQARKNCDRLIVGLNSDASVRRLKGGSRPVQGASARAAIIGSIKGVELVLVFENDTPLEVIRELRPDVLIKGSDYAMKDVVGSDIVRGHGGVVILADLVEGCSTTSLLATVQ